MARLEEAETEIHKAIELDGSQLLHHVILGKILYFRRRYADARRTLEDVVAIDAGYADAMRNLAALALAQGHGSEAVQLYRQAQEVSYLSWGDGLLAHALAATGERQ